MATFKLLSLVALFAIFHHARQVDAARGNGRVLRLFESWMAKYGFDFKGQEKAERLAVFIENMHFVKRMNARKQTFKLGLNQFAHLRFDEFKKQFLGLNLNVLSRNTSDSSGDNVKPEVAQQAVGGSCYGRAYHTISEFGTAVDVALFVALTYFGTYGCYTKSQARRWLQICVNVFQLTV